jgi:hypothetical protein
MEKMLVNIVEYLALGELETILSTEHPHQQVFYDAREREAMMQQILNRVPAIYMWLAADDWAISPRASGSLAVHC